MNTEIMLLTKENRDAYQPCVMPDVWQHMDDIDIFGYGIAEDNRAVGAVVCLYLDGAVNILSLGVPHEYRRRGCASQLLAHLEKVCSLNNFDEILARYFMEEEERIPLEALLTSCGYSFVEGDFKQITFTLGDLAGSRVEKQLQKIQAAQTMKGLTPFGTLTQTQQQWLLEQVSILWEEGLSLSPTRSCVSIRNGQIVGAALIAEKPGQIEIVQLYSATSEKAVLMICLFATMGDAYATLPPDTMVRFRAVEDIADGLITKLLDGCKIKTTNERIAYHSVLTIDNENEQE